MFLIFLLFPSTFFFVFPSLFLSLCSLAVSFGLTSLLCTFSRSLFGLPILGLFPGSLLILPSPLRHHR
ncbi:MAG: hypothetical protein CFE28_03880 [Alphaproteobacteria bacterium PA2]|nr:MAG: hypothetical protein CFE28_03880 [Alphaproteobacteria bacterium PA2]